MLSSPHIPMERWQNRVAVVTGAGSGIGQAIAKDLVTAGLRVVALDLREERLNANRIKLPEELQQNFYARKCDVSVEADVKITFEWIEETLGGVDILVNNAGINREGNIIEMDINTINEVINTNLKGYIYCSQAAFKSMKARNFDGHIVHTNSCFGHRVIQIAPGSSHNIYSPTKFAVTAINETIRNELRNLGTKIKTTSVSPGLVRTEIAPKEVYDSLGVWLQPEDISQAVLFAISTPPHVQIHEITVKPVGETF